VDFSPHFLNLGGALIRFKLGEQLEKKQFRDSRRITLQEVSDATAINRSTLSKILNQRGYSTGTDIVDKLCCYFGCTVSDLVEYVPDEPAGLPTA
jgi:putative transcriptional regulator